MHESLALVKNLASSKHVIIRNQLEFQDAFYMRADTTRLKEVVVNLLNNAIKYNKQGGTVDINCMLRVDGWLRVYVTDTGIGIGAESLERVFDPFTRLENVHPDIEGSGIGLSIVKVLIEKMGGQTGVESTLGAGSTFWFELRSTLLEPVRTQEPDSMAASHPAVLPRTYTVLCVEDNPANMKLLTAMLQENSKIKILPAIKGVEGLQMAKTHCPDMVLLDIHLPDINGYEVLRQLRGLPAMRSAHIVGISAAAMQEDISKAIAAGFDDYLTKPLVIDELMNMIESCARQAAT